MNSPHEPDLKAAMRGLSDVAGPDDLADAALRGAKGMRRRRGTLAALAAVATVAGLSVPFLVAGSPRAEAPGLSLPVGAAASPANLAGCQAVPMVNPTTKEVSAEQWPEYVKTVLGLLPDRDDYVVQHTYDLCNAGQRGISNAYAVINLGGQREHGHLTVNLYVYDDDRWVPNSCAELAALAAEGHLDVVFCQGGVNAEPLLYGAAHAGTNVTVGAVYADHRAVVMERNDAEAVPVISLDDLKVVVANQDLLNLIPTADGPLPTRSAVRPSPSPSPTR